jgi:hypothetical protein
VEVKGDEMDNYILFDIPGGVRPRDSGFLEQLGHRVMVCPGPPHGTLCPILTGEGCQLAESAKAIVFELDLDRPQHRAILKKYKERLPGDMPIRVVVRPGQADRYPDLVKGLKLLPHTPVAGDLDALAAEVEAVSGWS